MHQDLILFIFKKSKRNECNKQKSTYLITFSQLITAIFQQDADAEFRLKGDWQGICLRYAHFLTADLETFLFHEWVVKKSVHTTVFWHYLKFNEAEAILISTRP